MVTENPANLLQELKTELGEIYGSRLDAVYLFGSYARGEQDPESDLDILIVLTDYEHYSTEIERTGKLASRLSLEYGVSISRKFIKVRHWQAADSALLRNVRAEAISA